MSGQPPKLEIVRLPQPDCRGELREWYQIGKMFRGRVYGDSQKWYHDGEFLYTAYVKRIEEKDDHYIVYTISSRWVLYKNTADLKKGTINV